MGTSGVERIAPSPVRTRRQRPTIAIAMTVQRFHQWSEPATDGDLSVGFAGLDMMM